MKTFTRSIKLLISTLLLLSALQCSSNNVYTVAAAASEDVVAQYQPPSNNKLTQLYSWGLAKVETLYDTAQILDLITKFFKSANNIVSIMFNSFKDMTLSYTELHTKETQKLSIFDSEFNNLIKLRNKIDRKCLYASNVDERSICIEKGMDIHNKISDLRSQRSLSEESIERYGNMIEWCKSYGNWFC